MSDEQTIIPPSRPEDHAPGCGGDPATCYVDCIRRNVCHTERRIALRAVLAMELAARYLKSGRPDEALSVLTSKTWIVRHDLKALRRAV